jgi:dihydropyrimidinase
VYHGYADGKAVIDYGFHGVIQHVDDGILTEIEDMIYNKGISSFKIYMTYDFKIGDSDALRVMERLRELGAMIAVHAENHEIISCLRESFVRENKTSPKYHALSRPVESEAEAVGRIADIAKMAGDEPLYVVHLSTEEGLERIRRARNRGQRVYAETCPQYLLLDDKCYERDNLEGLKYIMSPPLRPSGNGDMLWQGIRDGSIQVVATDHCPFSFSDEKQEGREDFTKCPNGAPGVEERIPLMFSEGVMKGRISLNKFVEVCCANPARLFGMYPQKGTIAPGSDADIVIIDPEKEIILSSKILHSKGDYTAYEGFKLKGYPVMTLSRGEVIARDNEFTGEKGRGLYIKRRNNSFDNNGFI